MTRTVALHSGGCQSPCSRRPRRERVQPSNLEMSGVPPAAAWRWISTGRADPSNLLPPGFALFGMHCFVTLSVAMGGSGCVGLPTPLGPAFGKRGVGERRAPHLPGQGDPLGADGSLQQPQLRHPWLCLVWWWIILGVWAGCLSQGEGAKALGWPSYAEPKGVQEGRGPCCCPFSLEQWGGERQAATCAVGSPIRRGAATPLSCEGRGGCAAATSWAWPLPAWRRAAASKLI